MSSDVAITIDGIGKCYQMYGNPRDRLKQFIVPRLNKLIFRPAVQYYKEFWALRDITFAITKGETIGVIGRNGSGKSTLLQILCGTLTPTTGSYIANGKIAALLELGSGFNPEFTGRENVFMNASLLGLSERRIKEKFADIVNFADIGEFIDQPVKTYSSGMYVRLAFAVIAHVDADILVIDEALAVGDAVFTQKCMRFLRQFKKNGTIIFVSHDMSSVLNLCDRAIWLDAGSVKSEGVSVEVAEKYLQHTLQATYGDDVELEAVGGEKSDVQRSPVNSEVETVIDYEGSFFSEPNLDAATGWKTGAGEILSVEIINAQDSSKTVFKGGENVKIKIRAILHNDFDRPILGFLVRDKLGQDLFGENTLVATDLQPFTAVVGDEIEGEFSFKLPMLPNGQYVVTAALANGDFNEHVQHHWLHDAVVMNVSNSKIRHGLVGISFGDVRLRKLHEISK
ncbi:MAG: lipopolysaccharide transport system ATP-binding protein [Paracoccaceae bacterium]|jgi:lipopolysaccharide transport system ATP-binding protein